jgi:hypothetical protein
VEFSNTLIGFLWATHDYFKAAVGQCGIDPKFAEAPKYGSLDVRFSGMGHGK